MQPAIHTEQRFLAYVNDTSATLIDAAGRFALEEFAENGPAIGDDTTLYYLGKPTGDGMWVWEGTLRVVVDRAASVEDDYNVEGVGSWRRLTERERIAANNGVWQSLYPFNDQEDP